MRRHWLGAASAVDEDFLQRRVRLYISVLLAVDLAFYVVAGLLLLSDFKPPSELVAHADAVRPFRGAVTVYLIVTAIVVWRWQPRRWMLIGIESAGTAVLSLIYVHLNTFVPFTGGLFATLMISLALTLRAALVPSPVLRTFVVGAISIGANALLLRTVSDASWIMAVWGTAAGASFVFVSMVISKVIYGLRQEVRAAQRLGQYELLRKLGEGGMGVVYEATHVLLRRRTAIKLLRSDKIGEAALSRFEREVRETSHLEHPNSVYIYDYGRTPDGQFYYAMEYLNGLDLEALVRDYGPLPPGRVRSILLQAAHALAEAHARGIVHRDIKPANIMLCDRGGVPDTVKVLDFGLVKDAAAPKDAPKLTLNNAIVGTPHYMAPEAIRSPDEVGPPADVYALAAVGYFLLAGREVFSGSSVIEICSQHLTAPPPALTAADGSPAHPELAAVILDALVKDPAARCQSGAEFADALEAVDTLGWTVADARAWWRSHGQDAAPGRADLGTESRLTVDIQDRLAALSPALPTSD